jgi:hypothetical protein
MVVIFFVFLILSFPFPIVSLEVVERLCLPASLTAWGYKHKLLEGGFWESLARDEQTAFFFFILMF